MQGKRKPNVHQEEKCGKQSYRDSIRDRDSDYSKLLEKTIIRKYDYRAPTQDCDHHNCSN